MVQMGDRRGFAAVRKTNGTRWTREAAWLASRFLRLRLASAESEVTQSYTCRILRPGSHCVERGNGFLTSLVFTVGAGSFDGLFSFVALFSSIRFGHGGKSKLFSRGIIHRYIDYEAINFAVGVLKWKKEKSRKTSCRISSLVDRLLL